MKLLFKIGVFTKQTNKQTNRASLCPVLPLPPPFNGEGLMVLAMHSYWAGSLS